MSKIRTRAETGATQQSQLQNKPSASSSQSGAEAGSQANVGPTASKPLQPVFGGTVGMAINNAVKLAADGGIMPGTEAFNQFIHEVASDLVRIALAMERGQLAVKCADRVKAGGGQ